MKVYLQKKSIKTYITETFLSFLLLKIIIFFLLLLLIIKKLRKNMNNTYYILFTCSEHNDIKINHILTKLTKQIEHFSNNIIAKNIKI